LAGGGENARGVTPGERPVTAPLLTFNAASAAAPNGAKLALAALSAAHSGLAPLSPTFSPGAISHGGRRVAAPAGLLSRNQ